MSCDVCTEIIRENEDLSVNDDEMMKLANCHQKETVQDVKLGIGLTEKQQEEMMDTLARHTEAFSDISVANPEPMITAEDLFQRLGKSKYYSKIDLSK